MSTPGPCLQTISFTDHLYRSASTSNKERQRQREIRLQGSTYKYEKVIYLLYLI